MFNQALIWAKQACVYTLYSWLIHINNWIDISQNVFLAIVNDTYHWVLLELDAQRTKYVVGDYFKVGYNNVLDKVLVRERAMAIEEAVNMADADGEVTYEEIRQNLKKWDAWLLFLTIVTVNYKIFAGNFLLKREVPNVTRLGVNNLKQAIYNTTAAIS